MRPGVSRKNRETSRETFLQLGLKCVVTRTRGITRGDDCADACYFARTGAAFVVSSADVRQRQEIPAQRSDIGHFAQPISRELILHREIVLVVHLVLAIRIVENLQTTTGRRNDRSGSGDGTGGYWHPQVKEVAVSQCRKRTSTGIRDWRATVAG